MRLPTQPSHFRLVGRRLSTKRILAGPEGAIEWDVVAIMGFPVCIGLGMAGGTVRAVAKNEDIVMRAIEGMAAGFAVWTAPLWIPPIAIGAAAGNAFKLAFPPQESTFKSVRKA